jgi:predicted LPLAT superfamily acyltransferase
LAYSQTTSQKFMPASRRRSRANPLPGAILWHIAAFLRMALGGPHVVRQQILIRRSSFPILHRHLLDGGLVLVSHLGHTQSLTWILAKYTKKPCHLVAARIESPEQNSAFRSSMPEPKPNEIDAWKPDAAWKVIQALRSGDLVFLPADRLLPGTRHYLATWFGKPRAFPSSPEWFQQHFPKEILVAALLEHRPGSFLLTVENLTTPRHYLPWLENTCRTWPYQNFDLS